LREQEPATIATNAASPARNLGTVSPSQENPRASNVQRTSRLSAPGCRAAGTSASANTGIAAICVTLAASRQSAASAARWATAMSAKNTKGADNRVMRRRYQPARPPLHGPRNPLHGLTPP